MYQRWSTEHIAPRLRTEFWRDAVCEAFLAMTPRLHGAPHSFNATLEHRALDGGLSLNMVKAPAHGVERTPADLGRGGNACFFVNVNQGGSSRLQQAGREVKVAKGELLLIDSSEPYVLEQAQPVQLVSLAIPAPMMGRLKADAHQWVARPVPRTAAAALLATHMVRHAQALLAQHYTDNTLAPADIARMAGVSVRTLHAAFASDGATFSLELMVHRLERAGALLRSPLSADGIGAIAQRCGFASSAHFSRCFRSRLGASPSGFRQACRPCA